MFGAVIDDVDPQPSGLLRVRLWFWNDLAATYVTPHTPFEVWYGRTVGSGEVLATSTGADEGSDAAIDE